MAMTGLKRRAEDDLQDDQRFAKRFDLLNLEQTGKLYLPVQNHSLRPPARESTEDGGSMQVDDTKDRIFIHSLDDELATIDSEEEKLVFLPDIEKKLGKIPKSVLLGESHPSTGNEMVLYGVPTSLSVPKERDKVRKAIIESRERAREKQIHDSEPPLVNGDKHPGTADTLPGLNAFSDQRFAESEEDQDAMELG